MGAGKKDAIFRLTFLCHQAANFNILEVVKIFIDFSNVKVSNKVIHPPTRNYPHQNKYISLFKLN